MGNVDISLQNPDDPTSIQITFTGSAYKYTTNFAGEEWLMVVYDDNEQQINTAPVNSLAI